MVTAADVTGDVAVPAGYVANGTCRNIPVNIGGAAVGDAVVFSVLADMQDGVFWYGVRVSAVNIVDDAVLCNFSGGAQAAISGFPVRVVTYR
ncbi:hypothetical protein NSZ01_05780 [Nocardioides szechwanensis]|uniref:Uncharacterized protein n=1 Tax=Nocardioides szechwanensis TaxID=1005944 RepID=A0A1G9VWJ9_9ACTN|nr:hypothetical protein [Nocardioides szechwanensis]GEP32810.1 hypothetical protein NSZ01_05780 [Nocardioides szechwanensis]SDM76570.1 hypothetical protein SAMN05192576_0884 [Nocardioides szechwanensis]